MLKMRKLRFPEVKSLAQNHFAFKKDSESHSSIDSHHSKWFYYLGSHILHPPNKDIRNIQPCKKFVFCPWGFFPIKFFTETWPGCGMSEKRLRAVACSQGLSSQGILLRTGHVWSSAPVSFQAGLCGQLGRFSLASKLFSSDSDFQDGKDPFDKDQVQLWSLNCFLLPCQFSPKRGNWASTYPSAQGVGAVDQGRGDSCLL